MESSQNLDCGEARPQSAAMKPGTKWSPFPVVRRFVLNHGFRERLLCLCGATVLYSFPSPSRENKTHRCKLLHNNDDDNDDNSSLSSLNEPRKLRKLTEAWLKMCATFFATAVLLN